MEQKEEIWMYRKKLTIEEQIVYMRDVNGISFDIVSELNAIDFLQNNNYYFKLKSYAKNYRKRTAEPNVGKYDGVDFAYLQELSTIDSILRKHVLEMILDIEHYLKAHLLADISKNDNEDGYEIVREFLRENPSCEPVPHGARAYTTSLRKKYKDDLPAWVYVELVPFGGFIDFYKYYYEHRNVKDTFNVSSLLSSVRFLRNAAAHNNCLIYNLQSGNFRTVEPTEELFALVSKNKAISKKMRHNKLRHPFLHDLTATLYVYDACVNSKSARSYGLGKLSDLLSGRFVLHKEYFKNNDAITSSYIFVKKVVDFFDKSGYNSPC